MLEQWLGGDPQKMAKNFNDASPIALAHKGAAPSLLIHGTADEIVPILESKRLAEKLNGVGAKVRFLALEGASHNFDDQYGFYSEVAAIATERFFAQHLKANRPTAAPKAVLAGAKAD
jgi:dipeptidyl aminopeptidase/acylaminoacyl peptidase